MNKSDVIHQWDPDRDVVGRRLERQAIQIGIRGEVIKAYVREYIMRVEDYSELAHEAGRLSRSRKLSALSFPVEREYPLSAELAHRLGCSRE